jgi:hypothetical protein
MGDCCLQPDTDASAAQKMNIEDRIDLPVPRAALRSACMPQACLLAP